MTFKLILTFSIVQLVFQIGGQRDRLFFRKNYKYIEITQSFYKVHTTPKTWLEAKKTCAREGANFFYPEDQVEADTIIGYMDQAKITYYVLFLGISDLVAESVFETVDGRPIHDVYHKWHPDEPNNLNGVENCVSMRRDGNLNDNPCNKSFPFVCKKTIASLEWNNDCNMPDLDYVMNEQTGRCYKFHLTPENWTDAHAVCAAEQLSYLAVINSQEEANDLVKLTADQDLTNIFSYAAIDMILLGFHNKFDEGWTTVKGKSVHKSGYSKWADRQPDGGDREKCGAMSYEGRLHDVSCSQKAYFICEHEVELAPTALIADRYD